MSIWKIQVGKDAIWVHSSKGHVPKNVSKVFKELPNVFGIVDYMLIAGYYDSGLDHDRTLCRILQICRKEQPEHKKNKCYFRCTSVPSLRKSFLDIRYSPIYINCACLQKCLHQRRKENTNLSGHNKLSEQILTSNIRNT